MARRRRGAELSPDDLPPLVRDALLRKAADEAFESVGIKRRPDGGVDLSPEALQAIRDARLREVSMSRVPSTSRYLARDAGGVGVRKGSGSPFDSLSMEALRLIRERAPILQGIHAAREAQVRRLSVKWSGRRGDVGWRVVHKDANAINARPPHGFAPWIKRFEGILEAPAPAYGLTSTSPLFTMLEEDLLTLNRPILEVIPALYDHKRVVAFRPVDAGIVWPTHAWMDRWIQDNPGWRGVWTDRAMSEDDALDLLSEKMELDLRIAEWCLVRDGLVEATYDRTQLIVAPVMNRSDVRFAGYWPSRVEQATEIVLTFINTWEYNAGFFTRGMMAEFALGVSGSVVGDQLDAFRDNFREATQGVRKAWQPPIMELPDGGALTKIDLKPANREMMYEVFQSLQIALATAIYRMDPSTVNARPWDGGGGGHLGGDSGRGTEIALAKEEGLSSDMQHLCEGIFTPVAQRCHPDLRVVMEYGDFDPHKEAEIYEVRARVSLTRNEVRLAEGLEPLGFWCPPEKYAGLSDADKKKWDDNLWNMPADPGFVQAKQQAAQMEMQAAQQAAGGDPNDPDGGGEPPPDDGFGQPDEGQDDGFGNPPAGAPFGQPPAAGRGAPGAPAPPAQLRKAARRRRTVWVESIDR